MNKDFKRRIKEKLYRYDTSLKAFPSGYDR